MPEPRIAVDGSGNAYVSGITYSADFPFTVGVYRTPDWGDAFVAGFGPAGNLLFSTLIGGSGNDDAAAIALGGGGTLWVAGQTSSPDLPVTPGVVQSRYGGSGGHPDQILNIGDGWIARIDPKAASQKVIVAMTYLGGSLDEQILTMHPDSADNLYVAGHTLSPNFPVTAGAYQKKYAGGSDSGDGFLTKLNPTLTSLTFSTYFGGAQDDAITSVAVDSAGRISRRPRWEATPRRYRRDSRERSTCFYWRWTRLGRPGCTLPMRAAVSVFFRRLSPQTSRAWRSTPPTMCFAWQLPTG
jgi:hypothetical protein